MHRVSERGVRAANTPRPVVGVMGLHKMSAGDGYTYSSCPSVATD